MKKLFFNAIIILMVVSSCKQEEHAVPDQPAPLTAEIADSIKETAKKEISARLEEVIKGCQTLDFKAALKPYGTDLTYIGPDASVTNYNEMASSQEAFFKLCKSINFITKEEKFTFFAKDLVMCTWIGTNEYELKAGGKYKIEPYTGSMLFSKTGGEWKIVYVHESAGAPVKI